MVDGYNISKTKLSKTLGRRFLNQIIYVLIDYCEVVSGFSDEVEKFFLKSAHHLAYYWLSAWIVE